MPKQSIIPPEITISKQALCGYYSYLTYFAKITDNKYLLDKIESAKAHPRFSPLAYGIIYYKLKTVDNGKLNTTQLQSKALDMFIIGY